MIKLKEINNKILDMILTNVKVVLPDLSLNDEQIIRDNYYIKTPSWDGLSSGVKHLVHLASVTSMEHYKEELWAGIKNERKRNNNE